MGNSQEEKTTDSIEMKIPPRSKVVNYCWTTKQIAKFTGTLRVSGQVGVYFEKAICNAYVSINLKMSLLKQKTKSYLLMNISLLKI